MKTSVESKPLSGKQAQLFPTETCNLSCNGCPYPGQSPEKRKSLIEKEIDPSNWKINTDFLHDLGIRLFTGVGGELASYKGIDRVIKNVTVYPDSFFLLSTSGIHMLGNDELRKSVGEALIQPRNNKFKNGIAISFDGIPDENSNVDSRSYKARQGLKLVEKMQKEFPDQITYVANVMITPSSLPRVLEIQKYLEERGVNTNLCTQQVKCFKKDGESVFNETNTPLLTSVAKEMIRRKISGNLVVNSVSYLSRLPSDVGFENYHCWEESDGNPVIDVAPDGMLRHCNWIGQDLRDGPPGIPIENIMNGNFSWENFFRLSKIITKKLCGGCSWSRRDRMPDMVSFNQEILTGSDLPSFNPRDIKLQNLWVQAQESVLS
jgi:MoaA/NifB/PqqE/SkfB family radical SAM enzyme